MKNKLHKIKNLVNNNRFSCLLMILLLISATSTTLFSQTSGETVKKSIKLTNVTVQQLVDNLGSKFKYSFFIVDNQIQNTIVSVDLRNATLNEILDKAFQNKEVGYAIKDLDVTISYKKQQTQKVGLTKKITGKVTDSQGEPIIGASILVVGTKIGTVTDINGVFSLNAPEKSVLTITYIGFSPSEVKLGAQTDITVVMGEDSKALDEVVVVGYGTVKKSDLTGAVSSVKTADISKASVTSVQHMLSGRAAGVQVMANDAQPGGGISILIRGNASNRSGNEPLYIIDGFPVSAGGVDPAMGGTQYKTGTRSPLNSINPNDIESIEVLKDASSTAIYGARAANGVILITTKSGKSGKLKVNYDFKQSVQNLSRPWNVMNATEHMKAANRWSKEDWMSENKIGVYGNANPSTAPAWVAPYSDKQISEAGVGTDWLGEVTRRGKIQEHNLTVSGGNDKTKYLISINSFDQQGVVKKNDFNRLSGRINFDQALNKWMTFGVKVSNSRIKIDNATQGQSSVAENVGVIESALSFTPSLPVRLPNGDFSIVPNSAFFPNPVSLLDITNETTQDRLMGQAYLELEPLKSLKIRSQFGFDKQEGVIDLYLPKTTLYGQKAGGKGQISQDNKFDKLFNLTMSYSRELFSKHSISALLGYEFQEFNINGFGLGNEKFSTDAFLYNNMAAGDAEKPTVSSYKGIDKLASYFGRLNYNYADKYLLTASMRADGSTKFGAGNKFGYFPSAAFAWRVNNENFLKNTNWLSNLKLRLSAGQTGNSNIQANAFSYYSFGYDYYFGSIKNSGTNLASYANENLKWETTTEYNLGLDFGILDNRISATVELFSKEISDLLGFRKLKSYLVQDRVVSNLGVATSKGYEFSLNTVNFDGAFKWKTTMNISDFYDKWKERSPDVVLSSYESVKDPIRVYWGYQTDGLVQPGEVVSYMPGAKPGVTKVRDINGYDANNKLTGKPDGKINDADMVKIGNQDPDFIFGFSNTFEYKNFDLNIHTYGMIGLMKWNNYLSWCSLIKDINRGYNYPTAINQFWSSENQNAKYPNNNVSNPFPGSDQFLLQKADFIRVRNITLGYTLPKKGILISVLSSARFYLDVTNPFVFTKFTGIDPEYSGMYPSQKTFTFGANFEF